MMQISCVICGDLCVLPEEISAAPCGHIFHSVCLAKWIERCTSCPQCRQSATEKNILKLFVDAGVSLNNEVDPDILQHQIDNLEYQIRLRDQEISMVKDANKTLCLDNRELRANCISQEDLLLEIINTNVDLSSRLEGMGQMKIEAQNAQENVKALTNQISLLQKEEQKYRDTISGLTGQVKELKNDLNCVSAQRSSIELSEKLLDKYVRTLKKENAGLKKIVDILQSGNVKNRALPCLIAESPGPSNLKRPQPSDDEVMVATPEVVRKLARLEAEEEEENDLECQGSYSQGVSQVSSSLQKKPIFLHGGKPLANKTNVSQPSRKGHLNTVAKNKPSMMNVDTKQLPNRSSQTDSS